MTAGLPLAEPIGLWLLDDCCWSDEQDEPSLPCCWLATFFRFLLDNRLDIGGKEAEGRDKEREMERWRDGELEGKRERERETSAMLTLVESIPNQPHSSPTA